MRKALIEKALSHQLCENHAVREVNNHLWRAGLSKQESTVIRGRLGTILRTLRNFAKKQLVDRDFQRLRWRIDRALGELKNLQGS